MKDYEFKRAIGIRILEEIGEWTDDNGLETSMAMEMELVQRIQGILKEKGLMK